MQRKILVTALLASVLAAPFAHASDGTVNFSGTVTDTTCTVSVTGAATKVTTVTLQTVSATALATAGQTAGLAPFTLRLSNCSSAKTLASTSAAYFEAGPGVDPSTGYVKNTGTATNVALQLVDAANNKAIKAGDYSQVAGNSRATIDPTTKAADIPYAVQYIATQGAGSAGTVVGSVTYAINYQ